MLLFLRCWRVHYFELIGGVILWICEVFSFFGAGIIGLFGYKKLLKLTRSSHAETNSGAAYDATHRAGKTGGGDFFDPWVGQKKMKTRAKLLIITERFEPGRKIAGRPPDVYSLVMLLHYTIC